jgi:N-acetylglutamate synthase-like GNAT family acetyltransferase
METTLRVAVPHDAPRISELLDQLGWSVPPDAVVAELSTSPATEVVVAECDGDVVGLIAVTTRRQFQRAGNLITIDTLVVDESNRSQGIGDQLVGVAVAAAQRSNAQAIELVSDLRRVEGPPVLRATRLRGDGELLRASHMTSSALLARLWPHENLRTRAALSRGLLPVCRNVARVGRSAQGRTNELGYRT